MNKSKTAPNLYLVDTATLDVRKVKPHESPEGLIKKGYLLTDPEIYRRFKAGLLTEKSFSEVEYPTGSGQTMTANINYKIKTK
jgi:hypothetical protein